MSDSDKTSFLTSRRATLTMLSSTVVLVACGGGGGGAPTPAPTPAPPPPPPPPPPVNGPAWFGYGRDAQHTAMSAIASQNLSVIGWQYDIVCNGIELCSGAIRNHRPDIMYKAFAIAGYTQEEVDSNFSGMINAFKYGAPPHGGAAPGVDRIVMLLADEPNIREVTLFPLNQRAEDLLMQAPSAVSLKQLRELHIRLVEPPRAAEAEKVRVDETGA